LTPDEGFAGLEGDSKGDPGGVEVRSLFTVGHSNNDEAGFLALLRGAGVTAVADVRSSPYSRRLPHFSRSALEPFLRAQGITYVFLGGQLGGRPGDEALYDPDDKGRLVVNYERVRRTEPFCRGLERVWSGLESYSIALMCGEEDPLECHRGLMITPALKEIGLEPIHIRKGDQQESTAELEGRLLEVTGLADRVGGLFPPGPEEAKEILAEAYRRQNRKVAYRME
jgi:uncharacterized protein (DUF488 family)